MTLPSVTPPNPVIVTIVAQLTSTDSFELHQLPATSVNTPSFKFNISSYFTISLLNPPFMLLETFKLSRQVDLALIEMPTFE